MLQQHPNSCWRHRISLTRESRPLNPEALKGPFRTRWVAFPCAPVVLAGSKLGERQWLSCRSRARKGECAQGCWARGILRGTGHSFGSPAPAVLHSVPSEGIPESRERKKKSILATMLVMLWRPRRTDSLSACLGAQTIPQPRATRCLGRAHVPKGNSVIRCFAEVWPSCSYLGHSTPPCCSSWEGRMRQTKGRCQSPDTNLPHTPLTAQKLSPWGWWHFFKIAKTVG